MTWFNKREKQRMEILKSYVPTSKAQLLQLAMMYGDGDLKKAQELFDFYSRNLNLPDFDPANPNFFQRAGKTVGGLMGWLKDNQGDLINGYQFVSTLIQNKGVLPSGFGAAIEEAAEPLEDIN